MVNWIKSSHDGGDFFGGEGFSVSHWLLSARQFPCGDCVRMPMRWQGLPRVWLGKTGASLLRLFPIAALAPIAKQESCADNARLTASYLWVALDAWEGGLPSHALPIEAIGLFQSEKDLCRFFQGFVCVAYHLPFRSYMRLYIPKLRIQPCLPKNLCNSPSP
jgi:hypothetical protein